MSFDLVLQARGQMSTDTANGLGDKTVTGMIKALLTAVISLVTFFDVDH